MGILEIKNVGKRFGGLQALSDVNLSVEENTVHAIIGPNGAGKSTLVNLISGLLVPTAGTMTLDGISLTGKNAHQLATLGIARTFQNTELFEQETLLNNLLIGCHVRRQTNLLQDLVFSRKSRQQALAFRRQVEDIIDLLNLQSYRDTKIGSLSYGVRKMVEVARALCLQPKLLLLDEPSSGLNPEETEDLSFWIEDINEELQVTVLMVEHDMNLVAQVSDRVLALADGKPLVIGSPQDVQSHPEVKRAYLGD